MTTFGRSRCPTHDVPSARRIAQLEAEAGIDPGAVAKHQANAPDFVEAYANPNIIDCGRPACSARRW
ncbi:hypothetical protein [Streptomyces enissocaesilis]|uniref:Uncharacterized protein n=1 Tax=Streptomyces enissocaesilis TaxID=332589 RepID=A0ABP6JDH9_9ACTN